MRYKKKLFYIASPYSHKAKVIRNKRFRLVSDATVLLLNKGIFAFSPIAYNHPMVRYNLPTNWEFWKEYDIAFLSKCDGLVVLMLDGWEASVGVKGEIAYAVNNSIPITYLTVDQIFNGKFRLKYK